MLSIKNLSHVYPGGVQALRAVSLDVPRGMFGLLGPNGAGKSTLMRTIATLQLPASGSIRFDDIDVLKEPERLRRVLGYLPQEFGVYPRGSALDILDQLAVMKGLTDKQTRRSSVEALLHRTNLFEDRNRRLAGFSGGMQRRFGIVQALLGSPRLLIVDEPTAGLDPEERNRFYNLLVLRAEKLTVATAESCTGGFLAHKITSVAGSSDYFIGSVIAYDNRIKSKLLGVNIATLKEHGAVSEKTAMEMASGIRKLTGASIGVSTTGIAGPGGGTLEKPVGTVWIGYSDENETIAKKLQLWKDRDVNINASAVALLNLIRIRLLKSIEVR